MKTKLKIILITIISILMLTFGLIIAINQKNNSVKYFANDGYIIGNIYETKDDEIQVVNFNRDSSYKDYSNNELRFNDTDGERTIVSNENFVHYSDNSIMALKDGVAIDLNNIDSKLLNYYNIFKESVLYKTKSGYEIKNIDETILFNKLMFKISNNKYLVAAENIVVYFSDNQTFSFKDYVEIEYVSENVISIYNNESNYKSIASGLYILLDNVKIDLAYKTIEKNNFEYLTMANLVINSDDNIEVLPEKPKEETENFEKVESGNAGNINVQNPTGNNLGNIQEEIDTSILDGITSMDPNENIKEEKTLKQPKFYVEKLEVTSIGFKELTMTLEDEDNTIYGNAKVEIIENSTGVVVKDDLKEWEEGISEYKISISDLKPDTEYTLKVSGQYQVDDTVYDRIFVSKIFRTLDVGLEIIGDCATSDSLSFAIYKTKYSDIESINYDILDSNNKSILSEDDANSVQFYDRDSAVVKTPGGLNPNTTYKFVLKKIEYINDSVFTENFPQLQVSYKMKTLKQKPSFSDLNLVMENISSKQQVLLKVDNVKDLNKGIKSYTYRIYNSTNSNEPVYTVTRADSSELYLDREKLKNSDSYYFNLELEFDDNEKTIMYTTNNSNVISISGIVYPQVVDFEISEDANSDQVFGVLKIDDKGKYIYDSERKELKIDSFEVVLKEKANLDSEIQHKKINIEFANPDDATCTEGGCSIPVIFSGLKPNTEYVLYVYMNEDEYNQKLQVFETKLTYIGYEIVKTKSIEPLYIATTESKENVGYNLFKFNLEINEKKNEKTIAFFQENLKEISLKLYGCDKEGNNCDQIKKDSAELEKVITDGINGKNELTELIKELKTKELTSADFGFFAENYNTNLIYRIYVSAQTKNAYDIDVKIDDSDSNYFDLTIIDNIPTVSVDYSPKTKDQHGIEDDNLDGDTIVGFEMTLKAITSTLEKDIDNFYYQIYQTNTGCSKKTDSTGIYLNNFDINKDYKTITFEKNGEKTYIEDIMFDDKKFVRGNKYCLAYATTHEGEDEKEILNQSYDEILLFAEKQKPHVTGYLSKYNANDNYANFEFNLKVNDIDSVIKTFNLISNENLSQNTDEKIKTSEEYSCLNNQYCTYNFSTYLIEDITRFGLAINNNDVLYEFDLDSIKSEPNISNDSIEVIEKNGKLRFSFTSSQPNIVAILIDESKHIPLKITGKDGSNFSYVASINNQDLKTYGIEVIGDQISLKNNTFKLVYTDGTINSNSKVFALKQAKKNTNSLLEYYNTNKLFGDLSLDSIYMIDYTKDNVIFLKNIQNISLNQGISNIDKKIGQFIENFDAIHFDEVKITDIVKLDKNSIKLENALLVTGDEKYTTTGAKLKFEINNNSIFETGEHSIKLQLACGNINEEIEYKYEKDKWNFSDDTDHIKHLDSNTKNINFKLDGINGLKECRYSLKYNDSPALNNTSESEITNVPISSLKELIINNIKVTYNKNGWILNNSKSDLEFNKNLNYSFDVLQNYELQGEEVLSYNIELINTKDNTSEIIIDSKEIKSSTTENLINISGSVNLNQFINNEIKRLNDKNLEYKVKIHLDIEPKIYENGLMSKELGSINITNKDPEFGMELRENRINLSFQDKDGVLEEYDSYSSEVGELITINNSKIYGNKKYYFELINSEDKVVAYSPISLATEQISIEFPKLFELIKNLKKGKYKVRIKYKSFGEVKSVTSDEFTLYNEDSYKGQISDGTPTSLILFLNLEVETLIDEISKIRYTAYYVGGKSESKEISISDNGAKFTKLYVGNETVHYINMPINSYISNLTNFEASLIDKNNMKIKTFVYAKNK